MDEFYETWKALVTRISKKVARQFPEVEAEDLFQDAFLWIVENKPDPKDNRIPLILELHLKDRSWDYRRQFLSATGQYAYRPMDVRKIVAEYLFNEEYFKHSVVIDEQPMRNGNRGSTPLDFEDRVAVFVDVQRAYQNLPENYRDIIEKVYRDGQSPANEAEQKRVERAIDRMTDYLNYYRGDYGQRP